MKLIIYALILLFLANLTLQYPLSSFLKMMYNYTLVTHTQVHIHSNVHTIHRKNVWIYISTFCYILIPASPIVHFIYLSLSHSVVQDEFMFQVFITSASFKLLSRNCHALYFYLESWQCLPHHMCSMYVCWLTDTEYFPVYYFSLRFSLLMTLICVEWLEMLKVHMELETKESMLLKSQNQRTVMNNTLLIGRGGHSQDSLISTEKDVLCWLLFILHLGA